MESEFARAICISIEVTPRIELVHLERSKFIAKFDSPRLVSTKEQKADMFYNNAARFLRLTEKEIAAHHNR